MAAAWQEEEDLESVTCDVCSSHTESRDPRLLPCKHVFCQECFLSTYLASLKKTQSTENEFICPICHHVSFFPAGYLGNAQTDDSEDPRESVMTRDPAMCSLCEPRQSTMRYCFTCTKTLCGTCASTHDRNKRYTGHVQVPVTNDTLQFLVCADHDEMIEAYCIDCWDYVCTRCQFTGHADHRIHDFSITDSVSNELCDEIEARQKSLNQSLRTVNTIQMDLNEHISITHDTITDHKMQLIEHIEEQSKSLHSELDRYQKETNKELDQIKRLIQETSKILHRTNNQVERLVAPMSTLPCLGLEGAKELLSAIKAELPTADYNVTDYRKYDFIPENSDFNLGYLSLPGRTENSDEHKEQVMFTTISSEKTVQAIEWMWTGDIMTITDDKLTMYNSKGLEKPIPFDTSTITNTCCLATHEPSASVALISGQAPSYLHIASLIRDRWRTTTHSVPADSRAVTFTCDGDVLIGAGNSLHKYKRNGNKLWKRRVKHEFVSMAVDGDDRIIVCDVEGVYVYDEEGHHLLTFPAGFLCDPSGVCVDTKNNILVADFEHRAVLMFTKDGSYVKEVISSEGGPISIALYQDKYVTIVTEDMEILNCAIN